MMPLPSEFELRAFADRWQVDVVESPFTTHASILCAGVRAGRPVMLKLTNEPDELIGGRVLEWWGGHGAARVDERAGNALLIERATGQVSLVDLAIAGNDEDPIDVLCSVIELLHARGGSPPQEVVPLERWFAPLFDAIPLDAAMARGQNLAHQLIATQTEIVVLHGDVHHGNVLDFAGGSWRAIDPKGLIGERTFDYVNLFRNPTARIAANSMTFRRRLDRVARRAQLDRVRLVAWIAAFCALSMAWDYYPTADEREGDRSILRLALDVIEENGP